MATDHDFVMNLAHGYYLALGEFMFRCGQLENQMHEVLWLAIGIDNKQGRTLTIGADPRAIRGMLSTVTSVEQWIPSSKKSLAQGINTLINKSKEFVKLRNRIVHGCWQTSVRGKTLPRLLYMKERDEKIVAKYDPAVDDAYIHKQCAQIKKLNLRAKQLIYDLTVFRGVPPSRLHSPKDIR
jgi:hypothetical protein